MWIPEPDNIEECPTCRNLKRKDAECAQCARFEDVEILRFQKSKTEPAVLRTIEERVFSKKNSHTLRRERYSEVGRAENMRNEYVTLGIPNSNPQNVVLLTRGGIHTVANKIEGWQLQEWWLNFKDHYKRITGRNYYHRSKPGRPKRRIIDI